MSRPAALGQAARAAREEAELLRARCAGNEKLLLLLPEANIPNVATRQVRSLLDPDTVAVFLQQADGGLGLAAGFGLPPAARPAADGTPRLVVPAGERLVAPAPPGGSVRR